MKLLRNILIPITLFIGLAFSTTSANAACKARLGDFDWDSANIHTAISQFILKMDLVVMLKYLKEVLLL